MSQEQINEKLSASAPAKEWIDDFVKSEDPKFAGKTKDERIMMALGAYYAAQKKEGAVSLNGDREGGVPVTEVKSTDCGIDDLETAIADQEDKKKKEKEEGKCKTEALDPVGKEDDDIDNDGDSDESDEYLKNRRKTVTKAIQKEEVEDLEENMGTATITKTGHRLNGKMGRVFHKFEDGRINVQLTNSTRKGDVTNLTLHKGEYRLNMDQKNESNTNEINEEPKIIDKRSDKEIEQDKKAYADKKKDKGDIQHGEDAILTAAKNDKVKEHLKFLGKSLDSGGARRLVWVHDDKSGDTNLMAYRVNSGRLDRDGAKLVMKAPEDVTKVSVQQIITAVLKVSAPAIKGNDNQIVVKVGSESEAQRLIDKVKENNKKATSKDHKARAALYKRKDGFKVYITGETPAAIAAYKSMAESDESYDEIDMFIFENNLLEDISLKEANDDKGFYRLPKNIIDNDFYLFHKMVGEVYTSAKRGSDVDIDRLKECAEKLKRVISAAKQFKPGDNVPSIYEGCEINEGPITQTPKGMEIIDTDRMITVKGVPTRHSEASEAQIDKWNKFKKSAKADGVTAEIKEIPKSAKSGTDLKTGRSYDNQYELSMTGPWNKVRSILTDLMDTGTAEEKFPQIKPKFGKKIDSTNEQLEEGVEEIKARVAKYKVGDKTNFGVIKAISANSIEFKSKDLPVTKIAFNQRKMGSKDFVLDRLSRMNETVSEARDLKVAQLALRSDGSGKLEDFVKEYSVIGKSIIQIKEDYAKFLASQIEEDQHTDMVRQANKVDRQKRAAAMQQVFSNLDAKRKQASNKKEADEGIQNYP